MQKTIIASFLVEELERANNIHGTSLNSPHEGYAVILEELDELFEEIRKKQPNKSRMWEEAIQIGAMAIKFVMSMDKWPDTTQSSQAKCRQCVFNVMTKNDQRAMCGVP